MRLLLLGATGLVGSHVLRQASGDPRIGRIVAPVRRAVPGAPKLQAPRIDFERPPDEAEWWAADACICALGTTRRQAGSAEAFRQVDHDMVLALARLARRHGTPTLALVSAKGADPRSAFLYPRVKGEVEAAVGALGFRSLAILRSGLIGGERSERRPVERIANSVFEAFAPILPQAWRINPAERIAARLLEAAFSGEPGRHVVGSGELA